MYKAPNKNIWKGRIDKAEGDTGLRWHQMVECIDLSDSNIPDLQGNQTGFAILGFQCDEGVKRNQGRIGAADGPIAIRKACVNFAWHFNREHILLLDCGDIVCKGNDLDAAQEELTYSIRQIIEKGYYPLIPGGGHEVSFGGYRGVFTSEKFKSKSIGIINFDAHFDLRDYKDQVSSGTPFLQIADLCFTGQRAFNYMCFGLHPQTNTEVLFRKANELKVEYILGSDFNEQNQANIDYVIEKFLGKSNHIYLTIDMDVFDMSDAPGVSAPTVPGIDKRFMFRMLKLILGSGKIVACDIAEMNPQYDPDQRTAKLAAYLLYEMTHHLLRR